MKDHLRLSCTGGTPPFGYDGLKGWYWSCIGIMEIKWKLLIRVLGFTVIRTGACTRPVAVAGAPPLRRRS